MGWAKFDDRWATHPKLMAAGTTPTEVLEAKALDASAICYSAGQETDGFIPDSALVILAAGHRSPKRIAGRLVEVGRWARDDERKGYMIHDYLDFNHSRADAEAKRQAERDRKASGRKAQGRDPAGRVTSGRNPSQVQAEGARNPDGSDITSARNPGGVPPVPTRPDLDPPQVPRGATNGAGQVGKSEEDGSKAEPTPPSAKPAPFEHPKLAPLAEHLATALWPGRPRMLAECRHVVGQCLAVADPLIVDEAIGAMIGADDPPRSPRYLATTVRNRLVGMGAYAAGDEALSTLGGRK